jgi:hypothetical protein
LCLEPPVERQVEEAARYIIGRHLEQGIDARLNGSLPEQVAAIRMDRSNARFFQLAERIVEPSFLLDAAGRILPPALDRAAKPQLQLAGRSVGECNCDDAGQDRTSGPDSSHYARHKFAGLAGPGGGFDHEIDVETFADAIPSRLIGEL